MVTYVYMYGIISVERIHCHFCRSFSHDANQKRGGQSGWESRPAAESGAEQDAERGDVDRDAEPANDLRTSYKYAVWRRAEFSVDRTRADRTKRTCVCTIWVGQQAAPVSR